MYQPNADSPKSAPGWVDRLDTPVVQFARRKESGNLAPGARYSHLLPVSAPGKGQQYAFEVDLDQCSGCKACVTACHQMNGLDGGETWRNVRTLISTQPTKPLQLFVTSSCHHCVDPGCLEGCPALAYEKDPTTGIVKHLDDQCIGCQYCTWTCPYDVPQYNSRLGIVRKCDMCSSRLAEGEAPACVQACPNEAIRIRVSDTAELIKNPYENFLQGAPDPDKTLPTTRFKSDRALVQSQKNFVQLEHSAEPTHWPLVAMLLLSQWSLGILAASAFGGQKFNILSTLLLGLAAGCSLFHLGRPLQAWRALLGYRKSWVSREVITLSLWLPVLGLTCVVKDPLLLGGALLLGVATVFSSVKVYVATFRPYWNVQRASVRFFGSSLALGALISGFSFAPWLAAIFMALKLAIDLEPFFSRSPFMAASGRLMSTLLRGTVALRIFSAAALLGMLASHQDPIWILSLFVLSEVSERVLFFKAVVPHRMPGI